jgi:hypothetical protein
MTNTMSEHCSVNRQCYFEHTERCDMETDDYKDGHQEWWGIYHKEIY